MALEGLKETEQRNELIRVYVADARLEQIDDDLLPFEVGASEILWGNL